MTPIEFISKFKKQEILDALAIIAKSYRYQGLIEKLASQIYQTKSEEFFDKMEADSDELTRLSHQMAETKDIKVFKDWDMANKRYDAVSAEFDQLDKMYWGIEWQKKRL